MSPGSTWSVTATAVGCDPGLAYTGLAVVSGLSDGRIVSRGVQLLRTEKDGASGVRAGMDDARRMVGLWEVIRAAVGVLDPPAQVFAVEAYETYMPKAVDGLRVAATNLVQLGLPTTRDDFVRLLADDRTAALWIESVGAVARALQDSTGWTGVGLGQAAKTIGVQWIASAVAFEARLPVYVYTPQQMKQKVCGKRRASKGDVGRAVEGLVSGLAEHAAVVPASMRDHVHDAAGHAYLALCEYERWAAAYAR